MLRSKWIVVDVNGPTYLDTNAYKQLVRQYEADEAWRIVFRSHGVAVLHKRAVAASGS